MLLHLPTQETVNFLCLHVYVCPVTRDLVFPRFSFLHPTSSTHNFGPAKAPGLGKESNPFPRALNYIISFNCPHKGSCEDSNFIAILLLTASRQPRTRARNWSTPVQATTGCGKYTFFMDSSLRVVRSGGAPVEGCCVTFCYSCWNCVERDQPKDLQAVVMAVSCKPGITGRKRGSSVQTCLGKYLQKM